MAKHSQRTLKNRQEVIDLHDKFKSELDEKQRCHTKTSYYVELIREETGYSESHIRQILTNRYKKCK